MSSRQDRHVPSRDRTPSAAALDHERGSNGARLGQDFRWGQVRVVLSEPARSPPRAEKWDAGMMETGNPLAGLSGLPRRGLNEGGSEASANSIGVMQDRGKGVCQGSPPVTSSSLFEKLVPLTICSKSSFSHTRQSSKSLIQQRKSLLIPERE